MAAIALKLAIVVAIVVAALLVYATTKPNQIQIERRIAIRASPSKIGALIGNFHQWKLWAPQDRDDSTMMRTFEGPESGVGAISHWTSRGQAGAGRMEIPAMSATSITVTVDFQRPFRAHNVNTFNLAPSGDETVVTWSMKGTNPFMAKVISVFVNMDRMMGKHFESGLANLKIAAEK